MKVKQTYAELCMNSSTMGNAQLLVAGIVSLQVKGLDIQEKTLREALYRTMAKNSRLCARFEDEYTVYDGDTLGALMPKYSVQTIHEPLDVAKQQELLKELLNVRFDGHSLPWQVQFLVDSSGDNTVLSIAITMLHSLTDGYGLVLICKQMVESLHESASEKKLDLSITGIPIPSSPIEEFHEIADWRFVPFRILFPFVFVWRLMVAIWLLLEIGIGFSFPMKNYSGSLNPNHDFYDSALDSKPTGIRLIKLDPEEVQALRIRSKEMGGSVGSLLTVAGLTSYKFLAKMNNKDSTYLSAQISVNTRPLIPDLGKTNEILGSAVGQIGYEYYAFREKDLFWDHVRKVKRKLQRYLPYLPAYLNIAKRVPVSKVKETFLKATPDKPRTQALLLGNMGALEKDQLAWAPGFEVIGIIGSANSYWAGNRALIQMTAATLSQGMTLAIVYPTYMVTESEMDSYCVKLVQILKEVSLQPTVSVGELLSSK
jgi:hypothetical protein